MREDLLPGMEFAKTNRLTYKEIEAILPFFNKPYTAQELADEIKVCVKTLQHVLQRLKLKGLIELKSRDENGTNLYELSHEFTEQ